MASIAPRSPNTAAPSPSDPGSATADNQETGNATLEEIRDATEANAEVDLKPATVTALQTAFTASLGTTNSELASIGVNLSDIYAELLEKFEEGEDIGLSQDTMDDLATAIATLFNYPTDYPDAATLAKLEAIRVLVAALPTATPLTDAQLRDTPVPVSNASLPLPTGASTAANQTNGSQLARITDGTDTADVTTGDATQNALVTVPARKELAGLTAGSLNADLVPSTDVSNYRWFSLQTLGTWSGSLTIQGSNDNSTWFTSIMGTINNGSGGTTQSSTGSNAIYQGYLPFRYLRVRMTSYTSGTASGVLELFATPPSFPTVNATSEGRVSEGNAVSGNPVRTGGTDGTNIRTIATTAAGEQKVVVTNGTQIADTIAQDTGWNSLVTSPASKIVSFTTTSTNTNLVKQDVRGYEWCVVRLESIGVGSTCTPQASGDDSNYSQAHGFSQVATAVGSTGSTMGTLIPASTSLIYIFPLSLKWFRLNLSALSSGTFAGTVEFHTTTPPQPTFIQVTGTVIADTELPAAAALADGMSNPTAPAVGANLMGWSGTTWDRAGKAGVSTSTNSSKFNVLTGGGVYLALNAVSATGAGAALDMLVAFSKFSLQVVFPGTVPTTCVVKLEGSLDGTNYFPIGTWDKATPQVTGDIIFVNDKTVRYIRANCTTYSGSGTINAYLIAGVG